MGSELQATIDAMLRPGRGILAADESAPTIAKRFAAIGVESTAELRRAYRSLLLATPGLGEHICGVILFEETLAQKADDGTPLPQLAATQGIVAGIKVDAGKIALANAPGDEITQGLDGLAKRFDAYKAQGARFAKWRAVIDIAPGIPSHTAIMTNAHALARYAALCQAAQIVPIVEPEVLMDGDHSIDRCFEVTEWVLKETFQQLYFQRVPLEGIVLKPNMAISGKKAAKRAGVQEVAEKTVKLLKACVPGAVPRTRFCRSPPFALSAAMNGGSCGPWPPSVKMYRGRYVGSVHCFSISPITAGASAVPTSTTMCGFWASTLLTASVRAVSVLGVPSTGLP